MVMLFKEILEQPTRDPGSRKIKGGKPQKRVVKKPTERRVVSQQKPKVCATKLSRRGAATRNPSIPKSKGPNKTHSIGAQQKSTKFDVNIPSSTPMFTPIKKDKLPTSVTSSQCSLIELLQQYNTSANVKKDSNDERDSLDKTVTPEPRIKTLHETLCSPQLQTFKEVLSKLLRTVDSNSDARNNTKALNQAFEDVQFAFKSLNSNLHLSQNVSCNSSNQSKTITDSKLSTSRMEELELENASLQRKLRFAKREKDMQANKSAAGGDISLEVMTIQCQNKALEQKVSELTVALEQALCLQHSIVEANNTLKIENQKLQEEVLAKQDELAKSGDLFSFETREIKKDVGNALEKVEQLKIALEDTGKTNQDLMRQVRDKDEEILQLTELNKSLQGSVSRLLEDLKKASKPAATHNLNLTSEVLKKVDQFLTSPPRKPIAVSSPVKMKSPVNKPNFVKPPEYGQNFPVTSNVQQIFSDKGYSFFDHASRDPRPFPSDPTNLESVGSVSVKSILGSTVTPSLPPTDSVSCSMWSITSRDERDFNVGLASLDADIQRMQNSLNQLNV